MFTRKLNLLQINKVIEAANSQSLQSVLIDKNKKGIHMISYKLIPKVESVSPKSSTTIELIRLMRSVRNFVSENTYETIYLDYNSSSGKLIYQLELK